MWHTLCNLITCMILTYLTYIHHVLDLYLCMLFLSLHYHSAIHHVWYVWMSYGECVYMTLITLEESWCKRPWTNWTVCELSNAAMCSIIFISNLLLDTKCAHLFMSFSEKDNYFYSLWVSFTYISSSSFIIILFPHVPQEEISLFDFILHQIPRFLLNIRIQFPGISNSVRWYGVFFFYAYHEVKRQNARIAVKYKYMFL